MRHPSSKLTFALLVPLQVRTVDLVTFYTQDFFPGVKASEKWKDKKYTIKSCSLFVYTKQLLVLVS